MPTPAGKHTKKAKKKTAARSRARKPDVFESCVEITADGFRRELRRELRAAGLDHNAMPEVAADTIYYLLNARQMDVLHREFHAAMTKWARAIRLAELTYRDEVFDCDDFTWCFKAFASMRALKVNQDTGRHLRRPAGFAVGVAWGVFPGEGPHAVNWYLRANEADDGTLTGKSLWFFDPQSGRTTAAADVESLVLIVG
ncbi:MAG: lectin MOA-related protein [Planctomycetota bacterium]